MDSRRDATQLRALQYLVCDPELLCSTGKSLDLLAMIVLHSRRGVTSCAHTWSVHIESRGSRHCCHMFHDSTSVKSVSAQGFERQSPSTLQSRHLQWSNSIPSIIKNRERALHCRAGTTKRRRRGTRSQSIRQEVPCWLSIW